MATILGPNGQVVKKVSTGGWECQGDWASTIGVNNETKQPALLYVCKVWKDGNETQLQIAVENPPYTMINQVLFTITKTEEDALAQGYAFEPSEVAKVAQQVAQSGLVLQEFKS